MITVAAPMPGLEAENVSAEVTASGRLVMWGALRAALKDAKELLVDEELLRILQGRAERAPHDETAARRDLGRDVLRFEPRHRGGDGDHVGRPVELDGNPLGLDPLLHGSDRVPRRVG